MKNSLYPLVFILSFLSSHAQSVQMKDLSGSIGSWEGKLTYLDYSSGKPYTMSANLNISLTEDKSGYVLAYEYPNEPQANSKDTTQINGEFFGKERIVEFQKAAEGGFTLVTELEGEDGNDSKKATLRHTYQLKSTTYSITKEVKFEGTAVWVKRNEYLVNRVEN